ncbi:unnamed protein product [Moneuplotes crassus]|uniref:Uncharacterized protein n=1 Tax=Euplotes crassus TaxID=5936 RepID=A0AAD1UEL6_EUPCR|nr:unnamed protein product [Moneuplotes crassus]
MANQGCQSLPILLRIECNSKGKLYKLTKRDDGMTEASIHVKNWNLEQGLPRKVTRKSSKRVSNERQMRRYCCQRQLSTENKTSLGQSSFDFSVGMSKNTWIKDNNADDFSNKYSCFNLQNLRSFEHKPNHSRSPESVRTSQARVMHFYKRHERQRNAISHNRINRSIELTRKQAISHLRHKYHVRITQKDKRRFKNLELTIKNQISLRKNLRGSGTLTSEGKRLLLNKYVHVSKGIRDRCLQRSFHHNARIIQKNVRAFLQRLKFKRLLQLRQEAALKIQNKWKASKFQRLVPKLRISRKHSAATKIQKVVRGYLLRKTLYRKLFLQKQEELAICHAKLKQKEEMYMLQEEAERQQREKEKLSHEKTPNLDKNFSVKVPPKKRKTIANVVKIKTFSPQKVRKSSNFFPKQGFTDS